MPNPLYRKSLIVDHGISEQNVRNVFAGELLKHQDKLRVFIACLVYDKAVVFDLLQEVNMTLLEKEREYDPDYSFYLWACSIAKYKIKAYLRDKKRDRHCYDSELIDRIAKTASLFIENNYDIRSERLEPCFRQLSPKQRKLLMMRYSEGRSVEEISVFLHKTSHAINKYIYRVKKILSVCIEQRK